MQIANPTTSSYSSADDEEDALTVTVVPETPAQESSTPAAAEEGDEKPETPTQTLYAAVSACSNLHPDPVEPGDEDEDDYEGEGGAFQSGLVSMGSAEGGLPPRLRGVQGGLRRRICMSSLMRRGIGLLVGRSPRCLWGLGPGR